MRALAWKISHLLVCTRCYPLYLEQNKPFNCWEAGTIITHFTDEKQIYKLGDGYSARKEWISAVRFQSLDS